jgi:hypothetical protein
MLPVSLFDASGTLVQAAAATLHAINATAISSKTLLPAPTGPVFSPGHLMYFNSYSPFQVH